MAYLYACVTSETPWGVENKTLDQLKPYTDYTCVGNIETEDGSIKTTNEVSFQIDCGTLRFTLLRRACRLDENNGTEFIHFDRFENIWFERYTHQHQHWAELESGEWEM